MINEAERRKHIERIVKALGGAGPAGEAMEVSRVAVVLWLQRGSVPIARVRRMVSVCAELDIPCEPEWINEYLPVRDGDAGPIVVREREAG